MTKLEKYVCVTYICAAIVLGGLAGYCKVVLSDVTSNSMDEKSNNNASNNPANQKENNETGNKASDDSLDQKDNNETGGNNSGNDSVNQKDNNESSDNSSNDSNTSQEKEADTTSTTKKHGQVVNIASNLCIREKPDSESTADDYLYNGMIFDILEKDDDWYKIKYKDSIGYVRKEYVEEYDEKPPNLTYDEIHNNKSIFKIPIPVKVELTAYCNCAICSEAWGSETAMQTHTRVGVVAAPKEIPLGSEVYIPELKNYKNNGMFKVEDRGGAVVVKDDGTYIIDVWLPTHEQVKEFGRKKSLVFLTKE